MAAMAHGFGAAPPSSPGGFAPAISVPVELGDGLTDADGEAEMDGETDTGGVGDADVVGPDFGRTTTMRPHMPQLG